MTSKDDAEITGISMKLALTARLFFAALFAVVVGGNAHALTLKADFSEVFQTFGAPDIFTVFGPKVTDFGNGIKFDSGGGPSTAIAGANSFFGQGDELAIVGEAEIAKFIFDDLQGFDAVKITSASFTGLDDPVAIDISGDITSSITGSSDIIFNSALNIVAVDMGGDLAITLFGDQPFGLNEAHFEFFNETTTPIPLPAALPLLAGALGMLLVMRRRNRSA